MFNYLKGDSMKKYLFFIITALLLFLIAESPGWASEPLKPKWTREGLSFERICKPGKLIMTSQHLIDLTNGEILYQTKPDSNELGIYTNYLGDKFYVFVYGHGKNEFREFDTKTKQYIRTIVNSYHPISPVNEFGYYNPDTKSFVFYNAFTKELLDSIYYPTSMDIINQQAEFTIDNRYFAISLIEGLTPYFYLYDRTTREFLFEGKKDFKYCLFNKSNKMAYAENMKLAGDDAIYSYIRIYDPDQRKVVQDIKIAKKEINNLILRMDDSFILYELNDDNNTKGVYDYINDKIFDNDLKPKGSPFRYADSTIIIAAGTGYFCGNIYDWTVGVNDKTPNEGMVLYPNPTTNQVSINISEQFYSGTWQISDFTGKTVTKGIILPQNILQINVSRLTPQTYFLTIKKDKIVKTYKIVKV
jgi:hypothetical protein